jgi:hypothetical protein
MLIPHFVLFLLPGWEEDKNKQSILLVSHPVAVASKGRLPSLSWIKVSFLFQNFLYLIEQKW